jgi:hypothetical protein
MTLMEPKSEATQESHLVPNQDLVPCCDPAGLVPSPGQEFKSFCVDLRARKRQIEPVLVLSGD